MFDSHRGELRSSGARWRRRGLAAIVVTSLLSCGPSDVADPLTSTVELRALQIYDVAAWLKRVPVNLALPVIARYKLSGYLDSLSLAPDVRRRIDARLASSSLVDEVIPFLMAVKDMYLPSDDSKPASFDAHLRAHFTPTQAPPGTEHSMFAWRPESGADGKEAGFGMSPEIAVHLVRLYDALYLQGARSSDALEATLACDSRDLEVGLRPATTRLAPIVRELFQTIGKQMDPGGEIGPAVDAIIEDPNRLEAATATLIQFVDQLVCRHYRIFATRVYREQQLRDWAMSELEKPAGGALWHYLDAANRTRRYGVVIVVDGLQGHLVESLASGDGSHPFIREVRAELARGASLAPTTTPSAKAPGQQNQFLEHFGERGYRQPQYLPFFRRLYSERGTPSAIARTGVATTPTISVRNIPIAQTGAPVAGPGSTGVPNFHFVDRHFEVNGVVQGRGWYFFGNDAVQLTELTRQSGMKTLFDRLPTFSSFSCTAQYDDGAHYSIDALLNLGLGEKLRDFGETLCLSELAVRVDNEQELHELRQRLLAKRKRLAARAPWYNPYAMWTERNEIEIARHLIDEIARLEQRTVPELLVFYDPWPDHFAHFTGPFSDEIISPSGELNRLDYWLGRLEDVYRRAGVLDRTLFGMAGDHGLSPVFHLLNPEVVVLDALRDEGTEFRVVKISSDEGEGPKLTNPFAPPSMKGIDIVVASTAGGNYMLDLFNDQQAGFGDQPVYADLISIRPLALAAGNAGGGPGVDLIDEIATRLRETLDYLVVREEPSSLAGGAVRLVGERNGARAIGFITRRGDRIHYRYEGADLLDTDRLTPYDDIGTTERAAWARLREKCVDAADVANPESWCVASEWREMLRSTPRPDSVVQLAHLYDSDRAGTINLFPLPGIGYNSKVPGRHAGESFHEKDAFVGFFGEPLATRSNPARPSVLLNGSVPMGIYEHLTGEAALEGRDGWGYPSVSGLLFSD